MSQRQILIKVMMMSEAITFRVLENLSDALIDEMMKEMCENSPAFSEYVKRYVKS